MQFLATLKKPMIALLLLYILVLVFMFFAQRSLQYHPSGKIQPLSFYTLNNFTEKNLETSDGINILAWFKRPEDAAGKIILYFHGNAGNLGDRAHKFEVFAKRGYGVLAISYRGYAGSAGTPSEAGLIKDAEAALAFLFRQGYEPKNIILFGESLGSGIAVQIATKADFAAAILEAPFSSAVSVGQKKYWFVPVGLLLKDKFESIKFAPKIIAPVLIMHGTNDKIVPYSEGWKLFEAVKKPRKKFVTIEGAGHLGFGDEFIVNEVSKFLEEK
jgi:fermentation-respiration switch protein FrsA (DUF1100 family)